jgi:lysophospholipase L1-like esterase
MEDGQVGNKLFLQKNMIIKINWLLFWDVIFVLFSISNVSAQEHVRWDSTYRPEIYPLQVELFKSFKHSKKDIVFLGNSITFWGAWNELLNSEYVKNRGIPGDITFGVLDRLKEVVNGKPEKIFILIGINDIARCIPDSVILHNYTRIIEAIKSGSPKTKIFFQTLLPVNSSFNKMTAYYKKDHIKDVNKGLKKLVIEEHIGLIDIYSAFVDKDGNLPRNLSFDGVHLKKSGYDKWASILKNGHYFK